MAEEDAEELRKRRSEEQKKRMDAAKAEEQLKAALRIALDEAAYERMMNVSYANKEFYLAVAQRALAAFRQVRRKITDGEIVFLIQSLKSKTEHEARITFHKK
ncbi:hypothetical protein H0O02_05385 [Candidatus Micrarchaeota archaeon]|nr:hypothetical protein [Candidatus Micrarchaeota archaeon]